MTDSDQLTIDDRESVVEALAEAFEDYPMLRFVLGSTPAKEAMPKLVRFFVTARVLRREPVLRVRDQSVIAGAALVSFSDGPPSPPELSDIREALWADLGREMRSRYERYGATYGQLSVAAPHVQLNMLGVRPAMRGRGFSRILLEEVHAISRSRPSSTGVALSTEDPRNLDLYRYFGYEILGSAEVAPGITTWALFRPNDGL